MTSPNKIERWCMCATLVVLSLFLVMYLFPGFFRGLFYGFTGIYV